jgi:hypothetical protein
MHRSKLFSRWVGARPVAVLLTVGVLSVGLAACGSSSSTHAKRSSSSVVKKEAADLIYYGLRFAATSTWGGTSIKATMCTGNACQPATDIAVALPDLPNGVKHYPAPAEAQSPAEQWSPADPVQGSFVFPDRQQINFRLRVIQSGIILQYGGVELFLDSAVAGCASLPGPGPNGAQPPPVGDSGTYSLDAARKFTVCGHRFDFSAPRLDTAAEHWVERVVVDG